MSPPPLVAVGSRDFGHCNGQFGQLLRVLARRQATEGSLRSLVVEPRTLRLNSSMWALWFGLPGSIGISSIPLQYAQLSIALPVKSMPVSERMILACLARQHVAAFSGELRGTQADSRGRVMSEIQAKWLGKTGE